MTVKQLVKSLNKLADVSLVADWDNVGIQLGNPSNLVTGILIGMDVTGEILEYAASKDINTLIVHHPLIFKPLGSIDYSSGIGKLIKQTLAKNINIIAMHTNLDFVDWGVSDALADYLGLREIRPIKQLGPGYLFKLVTFAPKDSVEKVREAICKAGAGAIGNYTYCTFSTPGEGTFFGGEETRPYLGEAGQFERVNELKLEALVEKNRLDDVVSALLRFHPYEEVAYDIYPLANTKNYGTGRYGRLDTALKVKEIIALLGKSRWIDGIGFIGDKEQQVDKLALCGGSAGSILKRVISMGIELLICGELGYHFELEARESGLNVIVLGHAQSESFIMERFKDKLQDIGVDVEISIYDKIFRGPRWEYYD